MSSTAPSSSATASWRPRVTRRTTARRWTRGSRATWQARPRAGKGIGRRPATSGGSGSRPSLAPPRSRSSLATISRPCATALTRRSPAGRSARRRVQPCGATSRARWARPRTRRIGASGCTRTFRRARRGFTPASFRRTPAPRERGLGSTPWNGPSSWRARPCRSRGAASTPSRSTSDFGRVGRGRPSCRTCRRSSSGPPRAGSSARAAATSRPCRRGSP